MDVCSTCQEARKIRARGLCGRCYQRAVKSGQRAGHPRIRLSLEESLRLAQTSETAEGCWPWPSVASAGYPTAVTHEGRMLNAHVAVWVMENGPLPAGLTLDHTCHTNHPTCAGGSSCLHRRCVRPGHLFPATRQDQRRFQRGYRSGSCGNGHLRTKANTLWVIDAKYGSPYRQCRDCNHERYERRKDASAPGIYIAGQGYVRSGS